MWYILEILQILNVTVYVGAQRIGTNRMKTINGLCTYITKVSFSSVMLDSSLHRILSGGQAGPSEGACSRFSTDEAELLLHGNFLPILFT